MKGCWSYTQGTWKSKNRNKNTREREMRNCSLFLMLHFFHLFSFIYLFFRSCLYFVDSKIIFVFSLDLYVYSRTLIPRRCNFRDTYSDESFSFVWMFWFVLFFCFLVNKCKINKTKNEIKIIEQTRK